MLNLVFGAGAAGAPTVPVTNLHIELRASRQLKIIQSSTGFKDTPQIRGWVVSDLSSGNIKYSNVIYQNLPKRHTKCVAEPDF